MDCPKTRFSPFLIHHNLKHTQHVLEIYEYIARQEHITEDEIPLTKTAALLNDAGFIHKINYEDEEERIRLQEKNVLSNLLFERGVVTISSQILSWRFFDSKGTLLSAGKRYSEKLETGTKKPAKSLLQVCLSTETG